MDDNNDNIDSTIPRENNKDNFNMFFQNNNQIAQLNQEINRLNLIISKYELILGEYQEKYGNTLFLESEQKILSSNVLNNFDNISLKKNLLENLSLFKEYEFKLLEKDSQMEFFKNEARHLKIDEQKLIEENEQLKKQKEILQTQNDDIMKQLLERTKTKNIFTNNNLENTNENNTINRGFMRTFGGNNIQKNTENIPQNTEINIMYNTMKEKYDTLIKDKNDYEDIINKFKNENDTLKSQLLSFQSKLRQQLEEISKLENENNANKSNIDRLEIDNKMLKNQNNDYKDSYNDLEQRKNKETESLLNEIKDLKMNFEKLKKENDLKEEKISSLISEKTDLNRENDSLKFDRDHLTKIIEDTNIVAQSATEKEKNIDNIIKDYKKKNDDMNLEKEKLNVKLRMKENQITKLTNEYSNLLKDKMNSYENLNNITKNKYEDIIRNKEDEIRQLNAKNLSYKIEKDKYFNDYSIIKKEFDKINQNFHIENDAYIKKYEEAQKNLNNIANEYEGKITQLKIDNDKLESDNKTLKNELQIYITNEKNRQEHISRANKNENELKEEINKLKQEKIFYTKENSSNIQEKERLIAFYETKINKMKEEYDNKIIYLENTSNWQKKQLSLVEGKAYDMVKKQQVLTEKYKKELYNTINHYEGIINGGNNESNPI